MRNRSAFAAGFTIGAAILAAVLVPTLTKHTQPLEVVVRDPPIIFYDTSDAEEEDVVVFRSENTEIYGYSPPDKTTRTWTREFSSETVIQLLLAYAKSVDGYNPPEGLDWQLKYEDAMLPGVLWDAGLLALKASLYERR